LQLQVNGERCEVADILSLQQLVAHLNLPPERIAIELNHEVVRRSEWEATILREDDRVEIVHFVGGGGEDSGQ
jgi:thiamine biosynthesis protein ThiS